MINLSTNKSLINYSDWASPIVPVIVANGNNEKRNTSSYMLGTMTYNKGK